MRTDTQSTVQYWMDKATNNLNAADDFKAELKVARREIRKLEMERDLADRLADALLSTLSSWMTSPDSEMAAQTLAAWKEVRDGSR